MVMTKLTFLHAKCSMIELLLLLGWPKKFIWVLLYDVTENLNKLFGQPNIIP